MNYLSCDRIADGTLVSTKGGRKRWCTTGAKRKLNVAVAIFVYAHGDVTGRDSFIRFRCFNLTWN